MFMSRKILIVVAVLIVTSRGTYAQIDEVQNVLYVKADAVGAANGLNWADAYNKLQDALTMAAAGDQIWVATGTYTPGEPGDRTATFELKSGIGIYGGFTGIEVLPVERDPAINLTVLSGDLRGDDMEVFEPHDLASESTRSDNSYHVVTGSGADATAVLDGFIITGGNANSPGDFDGAGMINVWSADGGRNSSGPVPAHATLTDCTFEWNVARQRGGGVFNSNGDLKLANCTFRYNHAVDSSSNDYGGAGLYNIDVSSTVTGCTFVRNTTGGLGAGVYNSGGAPTISECLFEENAVLTNAINRVGGGLVNRRGSAAVIHDCVFIGNRASLGGGMMNGTGVRPIITSCLFIRNSAFYTDNGIGGGMQNYNCSPTVMNCTFSENSAVDRRGGGLGSRGSNSIIVTNCIFWANTAGSSIDSAAQIGGSGSVSVTYSCVQGGNSGEGNINADPRFADPQNGDYWLKSQSGRWDPLSESWTQDDVVSPCIDAGDPMSPIGRESFPNGGFINMGAYGGTAEASRSYFGALPCESIIAGDINGDCQVDHLDLEIMALHWTGPEPLQP